MIDPLFNKIYEFGNTARQMERQAIKSKQSQDFYTKKVKEAIENKNPTDARRYGENAIRARNDVTRYRKLSSKLSTIYSRLNACL